MKDIDELDRLHAAATAGEWVVRSYQEPSGEHSPAPSWEVYDEDNLPLTAALHNAWPDVSARLRAAEAEVERLRAALDNLAFAVHVEGGRPSKQLDKALDAARAALGETSDSRTSRPEHHRGGFSVRVTVQGTSRHPCR